MHFTKQDNNRKNLFNSKVLQLILIYIQMHAARQELNYKNIKIQDLNHYNNNNNNKN